ncbi:MAG: RNA polymerase sigma factor [Bacillota bacterium]
MGDELELIAKAKNGDKQAFGELALIYRKSICGLAYRITGDLHEAEDITQNVFIRAYLALPNFSPNHEGAFKSWLLTITSRLCIDYTRNRRFGRSWGEAPSYQELDGLPARDDIPQSIIEAEDKRSLQRALLRLPPNYRMVITLKYMEELDYREIAEIMKIPLGTVGTWIRRGLEQLRNDMNKEEGIYNEQSIHRTV